MARRSRVARSRRRNEAENGNGGPAVAGAEVPEATPSGIAARRPADVDRDWYEPSRGLYLALALVVLGVAAALRFVDLGLRPFHHDEGVNGWFLTNLVRGGTWRYDPANYHGPTLFYFTYGAQYLFGMTNEVVRGVAAVFGVGTVALVLAMRPFVGSVAALAGAALLAVSPGASFVSRYFIHEALLGFFTLAVVVAMLWYLHDRRERWLILAAVSLALMWATKETAIIHLAVLLIAVGLALVYVQYREDSVGVTAADGAVARRRRRRPGWGSRFGVDRAAFAELFPGVRVITAGLAFLAVYVVFFTSFFSNPQGLQDSLATLAIWTQTGGETQVQPLTAYLEWMLRADAPILLLGLGGGLVIAWQGRDRTAVFLGLWALGITMAYSLISYKTPWIALNMLIPAAIVGGIGVAEGLRRIRTPRLQVFGAVGLAGALAFSTYQALDLNFTHYDDETYPYVFVHTTRQAIEMVDETKRIGEAAGTGTSTGILVVTPEHWPLPWYYRDYPNVGFYGTLLEDLAERNAEMIMAKIHVDPQFDQSAAVEAAVGDRYVRHGVYTLRPGVDLVLYVRSDLAGL